MLELINEKLNETTEKLLKKKDLTIEESMYLFNERARLEQEEKDRQFKIQDAKSRKMMNEIMGSIYNS